MLNKVILIGRLTTDPVLRETKEQIPVSRFVLALNSKYKDVEHTDFVPVVLWRQSATHCQKYFKKGMLLSVVGKIASRNFTDNSGQNRTTYEVVGHETKMLSFVGKKGTA